jgi:hypothetical protein
MARSGGDAENTFLYLNKEVSLHEAQHVCVHIAVQYFHRGYSINI